MELDVECGEKMLLEVGVPPGELVVVLLTGYIDLWSRHHQNNRSPAEQWEFDSVE